MANFALNYSFSRNLDIPLDEDAVKATLAEVQEYVATKGKCYAGQIFSVTGDTGNNGLYLAVSKGENGVLIRMASQEALDAVAASAGKIDEIRLNGNALTINDKVVNIDLSDYVLSYDFEDRMAQTLNEANSYTDAKLENYAPKSYVTEQIVSAMTGGEIELTGYAKVEEVNEKVEITLMEAQSYTDEVASNIMSGFNWIPVEGDTESHKVRHWRGSRANYESLLKNNALNDWTRYVVIDNYNGNEIYTEYFGSNQISELTGQLLPVNDIIGNITEGEALPYNRYLVGSNGVGYSIYECVIDSNNVLRWIIKPFDYRFGVRVISKSLKNYIYNNGQLMTYDDVDCGTF